MRRLQSIIVCVIICTFVGVSVGLPPLAQLKVIGVRRVTESTHTRRKGNDISVKYLVRFRLEVSCDREIYLLIGGPKGAPPLGYALQRNATGAVWLDGSGGGERLKSPGVEKLSKEGETKTNWVLLPPLSAYEWEMVVASSGAPLDQSRSVFIREGLKRAPSELISAWYRIGED